MKVVAINGSPRKNGNTAVLLQNALEGAASQGAQAEMIHLYDYTYKGCKSCFACKRLGGASYGRCAVDDDLKAILQIAAQADALILGSPIYFGNVTGEMRSFVERLLFQYLVYDGKYSCLFDRKIPTGILYTMNVDEERFEQVGYPQNLSALESAMKRTFGSCETLRATDTYQFDDYSKYETSGFDERAKAKRRAEIFPQDCNHAYDLGARFAHEANG